MRKIILFITSLLFAMPSTAQLISRDMDASEVKAFQKKIHNTLGDYPSMFERWRSESERKVRLQSVRVVANRMRIELNFNEIIAQIGIRESLVSQWEQMVRDTLAERFDVDLKDVQVALFSRGIPIERFIANAYRDKIKRDPKRSLTPILAGVALTRDKSRQTFDKGLSFRHIALWPSHGKYFCVLDSTWKYQRPALFRTIEDLNTFEYCYRYLIPMLENSGAVVISPRERSPQTAEIIVDNDLSSSGSRLIMSRGVWRKMQGGFVRRDSITDENLFTKGTYLMADAPAEIEYLAKLPQQGRYGLCVSYKALPTNASKVTYRIAHSGGVSEVEVNQRMGGGTWVYLGEYEFDKLASITLVGKGEGTISADAIRFGGGMGSVVRGGQTSHTPRWAEAARYYMQYSGVPQTVYAPETLEAIDEAKNKKSKLTDHDYIDDYKARGDWVNYIKQVQKIPVDLSVAIHTNAGFNDSIFGTLTIHYTDKGRATYTNGRSKFAARDLSDIVLTQIVDDMRQLYTKQWTRRSIYDKSYAEVSRPDVPALIVEMFSHQCVRDMELGMEPQFRFDMSRAIYKGILRFLADSYNKAYVVQPLPVNDFRMNLRGDSVVRLTWSPTKDKIEPTANPTHYKVYTRIGNRGFDNGVVVRRGYVDVPIVRDTVIRSYRITALNDGGESFVGETLSCGFVDNKNEVAVLVNECEELSSKVPYIHDLGYVGEVYDRDVNSLFVDNENPGYGASRSSMAAKGLAGETLDNTRKKGAQLLKSGRSYVSVSK